MTDQAGTSDFWSGPDQVFGNQRLSGPGGEFHFVVDFGQGDRTADALHPQRAVQAGSFTAMDRLAGAGSVRYAAHVAKRARTRAKSQACGTGLI